METNQAAGWDVAEMTEFLPGMHETLGLTIATKKPGHGGSHLPSQSSEGKAGGSGV